MNRTAYPLTLPADPNSPERMRAARWLAVGAIAGPVLFELAWFVLGFLSEGYTLFDHRFMNYSPISQPISGLGMGNTAPFMNTAFIVSGLLLIAGVIGVLQTTSASGRPVARRTSLALLALTGVGQVADGFFHLDTPIPHTLGFVLALGAPVISFLVAGRYFRGIPRWRRFGNWLLIGSPFTLVLLVLFFATFQPTADGAEHGVAGLVQRLGVIEMNAWFVAMGWWPRRSASASTTRPVRPVEPKTVILTGSPDVDDAVGVQNSGACGRSCVQDVVVLRLDLVQDPAVETEGGPHARSAGCRTRAR
jgi:hypothetical membrane protein